jgi:hypothetical protein
MKLIPWYLLLCALQAALVWVPVVRRERSRRADLGLLVPAGAMAVGVGAIRLVSSGADLLTLLATFGTPLAAAAAGWAVSERRRLQVLAVPAAAGLWLGAWRTSGIAGDACRTLLIAGACVFLAALLGLVADRRALAAGLVCLVALDCALVWGVHQVQPASNALQRQVPPSVAVAGAAARPLPALQTIELGNSTMGWLDLFAPAVLGTMLAGASRMRVRAAVAVGIAAMAWGLLLLLTSVVAATVPVLVGLAVSRRASWG